MTPLKAKTLISKTADKTEFSEEICKKVIEFFYKELRSKLSNLECKKIVIDNFGAFYVKERQIEFTRKRYNGILEHSKDRPNTPRKEAIQRSLTDELIKIEKIQQQYKEDKERREFFFLHKQKLNEQGTTDLEGQVENN